MFIVAWKEKLKDRKFTIIYCSMLVLLSSIVSIVSNLFLVMNTINNSEWYEQVQHTMYERDVYIKERLSMINTSISVYGTIAIVILTIILIIVIINNFNRKRPKLWILYAIGFDKKQRIHYLIFSHIWDLIIVFMTSAFVTFVFSKLAFDRMDIFSIIKDIDVTYTSWFSGLYLIIAVFFIVGIVMSSSIGEKEKRRKG